MDQQRANVAVSPLADPEQPGLSAARNLPGHQTQPSSKVPAVPETAPVADCGDQRRRRDRTDPLDLSDALTRRVAAEEGPDPAVVRGNAPIEFSEFLVNVPHKVPEHVVGRCQINFLEWRRTVA
ncbi:hypothetical protein [Pararhodobacter sp. SW119]|uniref:hypothetical protein n=1 Tax=Pararhodobacter sp. SW119 TaxID=2780075 RepID=UPI001FD74649|nr:hypothetical protein [Pararhodobacter sp. SW119]